MKERLLASFLTSGNTLKFDTVYPEFMDFYEDVKEIIYWKILNSFLELQSSKENKITFLVEGRIQGEEKIDEFTSKMECSREDPSILINLLNPYFENIEDYETCDEILKIYKSLEGYVPSTTPTPLAPVSQNR